MSSRFEPKESAPLQEMPGPYDPGILLDHLLDMMRLKEDAALAKALNIDKRLILKIRDHRLQISGSMLLLMQEASGISISELRSMLKDRRRKSRMEGAPVFPVSRK